MLRIGVLCPSEIARRRFMPALEKTVGTEFIGIAAAGADEWAGDASNASDLLRAEMEKAESFIGSFGGRLFKSYRELLLSPEIDAVYIPLPPGLHYPWAKLALEQNKHVLLEKPFTTKLANTEELVSLARERNLAVYENYMFQYHSQIEFIKNEIDNGAIGGVRLYRADFGFPFRGGEDFRYNKALGGGALLDCGGYTLKLASMLLGSDAKVACSMLNYADGFDVDFYGSATLANREGLTAQVSFGMDNSYKCSLEVWGSQGTIFTNRIFSAPEGFQPTITVRKGSDETTITLPGDDTFKKSIECFCDCVADDGEKSKQYESIVSQARLLEGVMRNDNHGIESAGCKNSGAQIF